MNGSTSFEGPNTNRYYEEESAETGPLRVIVYGYDGIPIQLVAPPSPDYVLGPEYPPSPDYVPGPEHLPSPIEIPYVPEPEYPEYLEPFDDEAPLKDQPLPADASPIAASPDSDPEEDPKDDQADYPADGGDGDDEPSNDDDDDDDDTDSDPKEEPFKEEDKEHLSPADPSAVSIVDPVLPAGDTETLKADEPTHIPRSPHVIIPLSQTRLRRAQKTVRPKPSMSASMEACVARHAALLSPPLPVPSPPLPLPSPLTTSPTDTGEPLGYRATRIRMRALLPFTSRRTDIEADLPPRKRVCLTTPVPKFKVGESSVAGAARQPGPIESDLKRYRVEQAGYGITDTWDEIVDTLMEIAPTTFEGVEQRVTELDTTIRQRTDEDRPDHRRTTMLLDREAMYDREAWAGFEDRSSAIAAHNVMRTGARMPMSFQGTEGVVGLTRWLEKMESVFQISNCTVACQVKFASCTLQGSALTWWNSYMRAVGQDVSYAMPWAALKRMITGKYCPRGEIQKLESKYWNLRVKGLDLLNYNHRFQELELMCDRMFPEEAAKVEREPFVGNQDPDKNSSQSPPQINHHCCYGCGDSLEGIFCYQCTYKLCGNDAHYGYNCSPKFMIIPDSKHFNNQTIKELPPSVQSFDPKSDLVHDFPNVFYPPP
uniref:Reverse transcriptase domain-containing protein n=1 Tax=Tanacetum cinerariifolium TaxID=118510 RepID=A0A6L2JP90_TANCI|nr:reverse transcriptase domain-containing protein [Tanacetum cinerariifolium]